MIHAFTNPKFLAAATICFLSGSYVGGYIHGVIKRTS